MALFVDLQGLPQNPNCNYGKKNSHINKNYFICFETVVIHLKTPNNLDYLKQFETFVVFGKASSFEMFTSFFGYLIPAIWYHIWYMAENPYMVASPHMWGDPRIRKRLRLTLGGESLSFEYLTGRLAWPPCMWSPRHVCGLQAVHVGSKLCIQAPQHLWVHHVSGSRYQTLLVSELELELEF